MEYVHLICVKEGGKLRIKVTTDGYYKDANTQFPRDIRKQGCKYKVKISDINLVQTRGKYFYSVKKKCNIIILTDEDIAEELALDLSKIKIYTDEEEDNCVICMEAKKDTVFIPCGHFYACNGCSLKITKCPICRTVISGRINRVDFG